MVPNDMYLPARRRNIAIHRIRNTLVWRAHSGAVLELSPTKLNFEGSNLGWGGYSARQPNATPHTYLRRPYSFCILITVPYCTVLPPMLAPPVGGD